VSQDNNFLVWPLGKLAEATAYMNEQNAKWTALTGDPWAPLLMDEFGQPVVSHCAAPAKYDWGQGLVEIEEPEGLEVLRADAVIVPTYNPWVEPEE